MIWFLVADRAPMGWRTAVVWFMLAESLPKR